MIEKILIRAPGNLTQGLVREAKRRARTCNSLILEILWDWAKQNGLLDTDAS